MPTVSRSSAAATLAGGAMPGVSDGTVPAPLFTVEEFAAAVEQQAADPRQDRRERPVLEAGERRQPDQPVDAA